MVFIQYLILMPRSRTAKVQVHYYNNCVAVVSFVIFFVNLDTTNKVVNFDEIVSTRRAQAVKSILVQVNSEKSFSELHQYCSQFGTIIGAHHYTLTDEQFILLEYSSELEAKQAIKHSTFKNTGGVCVQSQFLWFRAADSVAVASYSHSEVSG